ncbi:hypothetical protein BG004_004255 [Podila humilis]|nr:hypothetical protein BG004_004255 [Podila humilis]
MEISMKEWKLLNAASNRAEPISTGRGPNSGMTFVTELKRLRHARGALFADHTGSKDELIAQSYGGDGDQTAVDTIKTDTGYDDGLARNVGISLEEMDISKAYSAHTRPVHEHGDIRIQRPAITSYDAKMHYPGIAHLHHSLTSQTGAVAIRHSSPSKNVYPSGSAVHKVRELLDSYPAPSPYCVDEKKRSPLHFAAASGDLELVEFLLDRGVRPDCGRDIAGNMPLHLAIISNRIDVVAALLRAGADMTLASPMTLKTPLDLAESRLSYLLSRAQGASKTPQPEAIGLFGNSQVATRSAMLMSSQSPALLEQIKGIVGLLRPYVVRQQRLQNGDRQRERQNGRSWELADKYMRQQANEVSSSSESMWRTDIHSDDNYGDMEDVGEDDEDDSMMGIDSKHPRRGTNLDLDDSLEMHEDLPSYNGRPARKNRRLPRRMNANETEEALESLMNGLSLLEASRIQQHQQQVAASGTGIHQQNSQRLNTSIVSLEHGGSDIGDGNLADSELDPRNDSEVEEALPDLLEQVQQVLQSIKLNETKNQL